VKANPKREIRAYAMGIDQFFPDDTYHQIGLEITNLEYLPRIISGEYRGLSVGYKVRRYNCSICNQNIEECPHEIGKDYNGSKCQMIGVDVDIIDISIVDVPKDSRCKIIDLLVIENRNNHNNPIYTWYGFEIKAQERFSNIERAKKSGWISESKAFLFAEFFSINLIGRVTYQ
jgi:hypothetical protein